MKIRRARHLAVLCRMPWVPCPRLCVGIPNRGSTTFQNVGAELRFCTFSIEAEFCCHQGGEQGYFSIFLKVLFTFAFAALLLL